MENDMNQEQRAAYEEKFRTWVSTIDQVVDQWIETLPDTVRTRLDFTPESLTVLEQYLLERFESPMDAYNSENSSTIDSASGYIGKVYLANFAIAEWCPSSSTDPSMLFPQICFGASGSLVPFLHIPPLLNFRTGEGLITVFEKKTASVKNLEEYLLKKIPTIEVRGFAYQYMFLLTDPKYTLQQLQTWLEAYYQKMIAAQKASLELPLPSHLLLHLGNYRFHFIHKDEDWVKEESAEMADNYRGSAVSKDQIRQCASRIEFYGDEDPQMDYFNEQFSLLQQLKDEPGLLIFDYLNNQFIQEM